MQTTLKAAVVFAYMATSYAWVVPSALLAVQRRSRVQRAPPLHWGPFGKKTPVQEEPDEFEDDIYEKPAGITAQSLFELMTLGAGAPNLGKFKGVDKVSAEV